MTAGDLYNLINLFQEDQQGRTLTDLFQKVFRTLGTMNAKALILQAVAITISVKDGN